MYIKFQFFPVLEEERSDFRERQTMVRLCQNRRQLIGFAYCPQVVNNIQTQTASRQPFEVQKQSFKQMAGTGMFDAANGSFMDQLNKIVSVGSKLECTTWVARFQ